MAAPHESPPDLLQEINRLRSELADWQAWRAALVESLPFNLFWKDGLGRFVFANSRFCRTLGRDWRHICGKTDADFYPPHLAEKYRLDDERVMGQGTEYFDIEQHKDPDGAPRWVEVRKTPLRNARGQTVGVQGLFRDVTDIKEAELALGEAEARYASMVESLPLAFWRKDASGKFTFANQRFGEAVGRQAEDLLGKTDFDLFPKDLAEKYAQDDAHVFETGEVLELVEGFLDAAGQDTFVQVFKAPLRNASGQITGTQGIFWDVTSRERADRELKLAKLAAEDANRAKSQFLANMSHEIRTPLNGVLGMAELLKGTELASQQREYLELVESSAESLLAVINDILDFSKVEAGKLELDPQPFLLRDGLDDLLKLLAVRAHAKGLELLARIDHAIPAVLIGDANRLRQVLLNLLGNAIKFTSKGEVELRVDLHSATAERIVLTFAVRDTGIGIPKDKQRSVFQAFEQADGSTTRRFGGTGLGLAIASRLVQLMEGEIELESVLGKGSTFRFQAAFAPAHVADGERAGEASSAASFAHVLAPMSVLIVDDHATTRSQLEEMLSGWGMDSFSAPDAASAVQAAGERAAAGNPFRMVLIDAALPDGAGVSLANELKTSVANKDPTVVFLTSSGPPMPQNDLEKLGVSATLSKPVKQSALFDLLSSTLGPSAADVEAETPLSVSRSPSGGTARNEELPPLQRPLHLLVAEDNPVNQKLALGLLQRRGHTAVMVGTGLEAIEQWSAQPFDAIVMDVQMPVMDGIEAVTRIRQSEQNTTNHIPILALTAHAMAGDRERCLAAGMDDYVSKPLRPYEFLTTLERIAQSGGEQNLTNSQRSKHEYLDAEKGRAENNAPDAASEQNSAQGHTVGPGHSAGSRQRAGSSHSAGSSPGASPSDGEQKRSGSAARLPGESILQGAKPSQASPLVWEEALLHTGGDEDLLKEILAVFLDEYPRQLEELLGARHRDDRQTMRRVAHALKSGCGHVGAINAAKIAQELETASGHATLSALDEKLSQLTAALADVRPFGEAQLRGDPTG